MPVSGKYDAIGLAIMMTVLLVLLALAIRAQVKKQRELQQKKPRVIPQSFAELSRQIERL